MVYNMLQSNILFARKSISIVKYKELAVRLTLLILYAFLLLYFRWWIMDFEGPTFTSIDNPAAYSNSLFSKVHIKSNQNHNVYHTLQLKCRYSHTTTFIF